MVGCDCWDVTLLYGWIISLLWFRYAGYITPSLQLPMQVPPIATLNYRKLHYVIPLHFFRKACGQL